MPGRGRAALAAVVAAVLVVVGLAAFGWSSGWSSGRPGAAAADGGVKSGAGPGGTGGGTPSAAGAPGPSDVAPVGSSVTAHAHQGPAHAPAPVPLRPGERRVDLTVPAAYTPSAPTGVGTDDYRCFLLDPALRRPAWLTGTDVRPGNPDVVHHVILFQVRPAQVAAAERVDAASRGEGWTCFGGSGLPGDFGRLDDASWLGAWAPGAREAVAPDRYGVRLAPGSRVVMQVHYNLLAGAEPDRSAVRLRLAPGAERLTALHTYLLPAPVELPCRAAHADGPLCDRDAAVADVLQRFGAAGNTNSLLHLLCGTKARPSSTTSCTRTIGRPMTVLGAAGHMHLLGRSISIVADPGTAHARPLLRIPLWNFDDQAAVPVPAVRLEPFDRVRVTCRHVQWLRDRLPAFAGQPDRYVVWGEGTTDEMCLGMLQVAFDD